MTCDERSRSLVAGCLAVVGGPKPNGCTGAMVTPLEQAWDLDLSVPEAVELPRSRMNRRADSRSLLAGCRRLVLLRIVAHME